MKRGLSVTIFLLMFSLFATIAFSDTSRGKIDPKKEFEKHCAVCHPDGQNTINARKPLNRKSLAANGIKSTKDIVAKMRNPGPGMTRFDEKTIPDKEANEIAKYILKTF
ncbi:MAG TPA: c-type cytochrome [Desulfuromonadaceae bacterium]|jgi:cytochrome c6